MLGDYFMIKVAFGKACKEFRENKNISQEKFALAIGMDRTYYSSVESGKRNISIKNIEKIANGLDVPISILMAKTLEYKNMLITKMEETNDNI